ncbi:MAG: PrsW family intramembrane metalloprotease [Xanthomonadales bacterium]|nr:PrsW family intramembrane metalloprotease [Xanthomonadales bacterium]
MNPYSIMCLPIFAPIAFWAWYHYYKDRHLPEPVGYLALAFLLGMGSSYLAGWMYQSLDWFGLRRDALLLAETSRLGLLVYAVSTIGVIEELAKLLPFVLIVVRLPAFNEPVDGIIYGSVIALGFAAVENVQYVQFMTLPEAIARGFAGPVVHMVFASIWGYYIGRALLCGRTLWRVVPASLGFTALVHGIYDFVVIAYEDILLPVAAFLILVLWLWRLALIRDLHLEPPGRCPSDPGAAES